MGRDWGEQMGLLKEKADDLYRMKGVLNIAKQGDIKFVMHGVHLDC